MISNWGLVLCSLLLGASATPVKKRFSPNVPRNGLYKLDVVDQLQEETMAKVEAWMATKDSTCTLENAAIRREWSDLSVEERREYIDAVLCLQKLPPKAPKDKIPGVNNRYDDFVATHMTQVGMLHSPTNLLASHRYYIWAFEQALRDECGYKGYQPYMNYDRYAQDPINSPMFNGNETSMGGNGAPHDYPGVMQPFPAPYNRIPAAGGGGCVTEGPFKDMVVSLGPGGTVVRDIPRNPRADGLGANPRCLRRDVNVHSALGATANYSYSLVMDNPDIDSFYNRYLGQPMLRDDPHPWGLHNAGHYIIGGDPGGDFFASPGDPAFWFHHGMLDRLWWLWQMQEPETRVDAIPGLSFGLGRNDKRQFGGGAGGFGGGAGGFGGGFVGGFNNGRAGGADSVIDLQWTAPAVPLKDLNDQLGGAGGKMCYIYV